MKITSTNYKRIRNRMLAMKPHYSHKKRHATTDYIAEYFGLSRSTTVRMRMPENETYEQYIEYCHKLQRYKPHPRAIKND